MLHYIKSISLFCMGIVSLLFLNFHSLKAQQSQNELLDNFTTASLTIFKVIPLQDNTYTFEKTSKPWPVSLEKNGQNISKLIINRAGIIEEPYQPDLKSYPAYFKDQRHRIVFIDDNFYYLKCTATNQPKTQRILSKQEIWVMMFS